MSHRTRQSVRYHLAVGSTSELIALLALPLVCVPMLVTKPAIADEPVNPTLDAPGPPPGELPKEWKRLVLDDGRIVYPKAEKDTVNLNFHGEFQIRGERLSDLPLRPPATDPSLSNLGQRTYATSWLRVGGQFAYSNVLKVVLQADLFPRFIVGDLTQGVSAAWDWARDENIPSPARLRYAYVDWTTPVGLLRVGQMGSHWGLGLVANDGDHPVLFGDYKWGSIVERVAFATRPGGKDSPFVIALAGDLVFSDNTAKLNEGDRATQGVLAAYYEKGETQFGLYGVRRNHKVASFGDSGNLRLWVIDAAARTAAALGPEDMFIHAAIEMAAIFGTTDAIRSTPEFLEQKIRSYGGAAQLGFVKQAVSRDGTLYGKWVTQLEAGYASGDADPYDGTIKRFTFDGSHQVGLVLFPFVMHFSNARAATNAKDPELLARPTPGARFLSSNMGVFGAQYLNPTVLFRPRPNLDLKAGLLIAVATSDTVDSFGVGFTGRSVGFLGGDAKNRDLGLELDGGVEWRLALSSFSTLQLGAQAGVLFPGRAFDNANGDRMKPQSVLQLRTGMQF